MDIFNRLLSLSECILKILQNLTKERLELLNDLLLEEENFLDSINKTNWNSLIKYIETTYNLNWNKQIYEVVKKNNLELPVLRIYKLIKERLDEKKITPLNHHEINDLVEKENPFAQKIKKILEENKQYELFKIRDLLSKEEYKYIYTSFSTPEPTYKDLKMVNVNKINKYQKNIKSYENIQAFTYEEIKQYEKTRLDLWIIAAQELKIFLEVCESKLAYERKEDRNNLYTKLLKFNKIRKNIYEEITSMRKFKEYIKFIQESSHITVPFQILECASNIFCKNDFINQERIKKLITERTYKSILEEKVPEVEQISYPNIRIENNFNKILKNLLNNAQEIYITNKESFIKQISYIIDEGYAKFLIQYMMDSKIDKNKYRTYFLLLYRNPNALEKIIKEDFDEYTLQTSYLTKSVYDQNKNIIFDMIENVYLEYITKKDEFSQSAYNAYIKNTANILSQEDYIKVEEKYLTENKRKI